MVADRVPLFRHSSDDLRVALALFANDKKSCFSPVRGQSIEQSRRVFWVGAVIECKIDGAGAWQGFH